jgi:hypothetical protein
MLEDNSIQPQNNPSRFVAQSVEVNRIPRNGTEPEPSHFQTQMRELAREEGKATITLRIRGEPVVESEESTEMTLFPINKEVGEPIVVDLDELPAEPDLQTAYEYQEN